jgi:hypothetical protein
MQPSLAAISIAEKLVNHQWGVSVHQLAVELDKYKNAALYEVLDILREEGYLGLSYKRICKLFAEESK